MKGVVIYKTVSGAIMARHTFNHSTQEAQADEPPGLHNKPALNIVRPVSKTKGK